MASQILQLCTLASWQKRVLSISRESRVIFAFNPFLIFVLLFLKATKVRKNNYEQNVIFDTKVPIYCISANKIKLLHQILETEYTKSCKILVIYLVTYIIEVLKRDSNFPQCSLCP
jgi:hypothetical protein